MSTQDEIKKLSDGHFHRLGDDLLRRLDPRYRRLRTHGLNDRGESIKGQPDSYVGDTAATCSVAVCYTVQRNRWWDKLVDDVGEAVAASPTANEIVVVFPHNADRDGPGNKGIDWLSNARTAAGKASLRVIDGREIASQLDSDHQDLRYEHLGIPYSRLSGPSLLAGCQAASLKVLDSIQASGRYDLGRYVPRSADGELYRLWQTATRPGFDLSRRVGPVRLIALVNDSGVGKTSLVCEFARKLGMVLPVLLVQARDLLFGTEDSLVAYVIHAIQGFLDPAARVLEEAALCKHLAGTIPLTVILDGLDEAHDPEAVRRAVSHWLMSRLGRSSILIVTSRREFWRTCADASWERWMPSPDPEDRSPVKIAERTQGEHSDPVAGIKLPDRFSEDELEVAWVRAARPREELFAFAKDVRAELRHPFTLRVFLDIRNQGGHLPRTLKKADLLEFWLNRRLDAEAMPRERITRSHFQEALRVVAKRSADASLGSLTVDELTGVPRFDPVHPPGPVLQRLIEANILESLPSQPDKVRFSIEAVQDFYQAEADIEEIKIDPGRMAEMFSRLRFTAACPRLERIAQGLVGESMRDGFARRLVELDARMASVVVRSTPGRFAPDILAKITEELGRQISACHRVRAATAIALLGEMNCPESADTLASALLPPADIHRYLKSFGAMAFTRLGYVPAAEFVYRWMRSGLRANGDTYYFRNLLGALRDASLDFRNALAEQALQQIANPSRTNEHAKAVGVMAYLGDDRLVAHLETRLAENGILCNYENHALVALGTHAAGVLFAQSVWAAVEMLAHLQNENSVQDKHNKLLNLFKSKDDMRYLLSSPFEPHLKRLIEADNPHVSWVACYVAKRGLMASLLYSVAVAADQRGEFELERNQDRAFVTTDLWLGWWRATSELRIRRRLLQLLPRHPSAEVEEILIGCLDSPDLRDLAARQLGTYGVARAAASLRGILAEAITEDDHWGKAEAAHALGDLRDEAAVPWLERTAAEHTEDRVVREAVESLGLIGVQEAEGALRRLLQIDKGEAFQESVFEALLLCGSRTAVGTVVEHGRSRPDGFSWICKRLCDLCGIRVWRRGEYYTHIITGELVDYLGSHYQLTWPEAECDVGEAFCQIDSKEVRELLRQWSGLDRPVQDSPLREDGQRRLSATCREELRNRGDESAIDFTLDERADDDDDVYVWVTASNLRNFQATSVAERLRLRLESAETASQVVRMLALLGRFGTADDADLAGRYLNHPDDLVANVACETMLRLSDPMLVPEQWREV